MYTCALVYWYVYFIYVMDVTGMFILICMRIYLLHIQQCICLHMNIIRLIYYTTWPLTTCMVNKRSRSPLTPHYSTPDRSIKRPRTICLYVQSGCISIWNMSISLSIGLDCNMDSSLKERLVYTCNMCNICVYISATCSILYVYKLYICLQHC